MRMKRRGAHTEDPVRVQAVLRKESHERQRVEQTGAASAVEPGPQMHESAHQRLRVPDIKPCTGRICSSTAYIGRSFSELAAAAQAQAARRRSRPFGRGGASKSNSSRVRCGDSIEIGVAA